MRYHSRSRIKPVIDSRYPLELIAEAHRHVDIGHNEGNIIITLDLITNNKEGK